MRRLTRILAALLVLSVTLSIAGCTPSGAGSVPAGGSKSPSPTVQKPPRPTGKTSLKISVVGDIMMHMPQVTAGKRRDGSYDFRGFFDKVKPLIESADVAMCNLETTISTPEKGYSGYPLFKSPEALLDALKYAGFDVVTAANNHAFDGKEFGVVHTLDKLDEYGFVHTGRARTQEERDRLLLLTKKDITIAVLAYTYGTNGMEGAIDKSKRGFMVNLIDEKTIASDIKRAREAGAEMVIVCMHWGAEYVRKPGAEQVKLADGVFQAGADVIFGSHPHVLQPMERKVAKGPDGKDHDVFVIYSLGNFISNQTHDYIKYTDSGAIVNLEIVKDYDNGTVSLGEINYTPTWVHRFTRQGRWDYQVLPVSDTVDAGLPEAARQRITAVWKETTSLMGNGKFRTVR